MKMMSKLVLAATFCLCSAGIAMASITPTFDIDFYGGDSGLNQGVYDTGTNLNLGAGQSVSVDILVSGFDEPGNGLVGWGFTLDYGKGLALTNDQIDSDNWFSFASPIRGEDPETNNSILGMEGLVHLGQDAVVDPDTGEAILLFSFDLTVEDEMAALLVLSDLDGRTNFATELNEVLDGHLPVDLASINADNPVPVPAAVWLLGSGLTSLLAIRRRKSLKQD